MDTPRCKTQKGTKSGLLGIIVDMVTEAKDEKKQILPTLKK